MTASATPALSMYQASVPACLQMMKGLLKALNKAVAFATDQGKSDEAILQTRLAPDMFPLVKQVQMACDHAKFIPSRLAGVPAPSHPDTETTLAQLIARVETVIAYLKTFTPEQLQGGQDRDVTVLKGTPWEREFKGLAYMSFYGLPNLYFHTTAAYAIMRHLGVPVGKVDYLAA